MDGIERAHLLMSLVTQSDNYEKLGYLITAIYLAIFLWFCIKFTATEIFWIDVAFIWRCSFLMGVKFRRETKACLAPRLYGSLAPSRLNALLPCVSTIVLSCYYLWTH